MHVKKQLLHQHFLHY